MVAWHEVPGKASPQKSRPVGYGLIRAGVRGNSMTAKNRRARACRSLRVPYQEYSLHPYLTERLVWVALSPGTLCQATVAPLLRDIRQQALAMRLVSRVSLATDN
jgi:hypothetical protein